MIAHPTDERLYERARDQLVTLAQEAGGGASAVLRPACPAACTAGRPLRSCQAVQAHAQSIEKAEGLYRPRHGSGRRLNQWRLPLTLRRNLDDIPEGNQLDRIITKLALVSQLLHQMVWLPPSPDGIVMFQGGGS